MRTFRVILVAVRNLGAGRNAVVERAAQIAAGCGARLELFHDLSTPIYVDTQLGSGESLAELTRATRATALGRLERIAEPLRKRGLKVTTAAVWDFPPYEAVIRRAMAIRADLIVALRAPLHAVHVQAPWVSEIADRRSLLARNAKAAGIKASRLHLLEGDPDADAAAGVHDLKDEAFAYLLANLANTELAHAREELAAIQTALQRIAEGSYGTCGDCDGAIGRARLLVQPSADRCLSCQERAERALAARTEFSG